MTSLSLLNRSCSVYCRHCPWQPRLLQWCTVTALETQIYSCSQIVVYSQLHVFQFQGLTFLSFTAIDLYCGTINGWPISQQSGLHSVIQIIWCRLVRTLAIKLLERIEHIAAEVQCEIEGVHRTAEPACRFDIDLPKPTGYVMHHQFNIQQLYAPSTLYLCVLYLSEKKQRLVAHTT